MTNMIKSVDEAPIWKPTLNQITVLDESLQPLIFDRSGWTHF
jgi:hypothetical protein